MLRYNLLPPLQHKPENRYELGRASDFHAQTATRVGAGQAFHRATGIWRLVHPFAGLDSRVRRRHPAFDRLHIVFALAVAALSIGTVQLLGVSRSLNEAMVNLLESHPGGVLLHGRYFYPNYIIVFSIITLFVTLLILSILGTAYLRKKYANNHPELTNLRQDADDIIRYANNITGYIYGGEKDLPRFDIIEINARHHVALNGDTAVSSMFEIHCTTDAAHFWKYWIDADAESDAVRSLRLLNFEVVDVETSQKLDWLPTLGDTRHKIFAIFFPEVKPGERKRLRISYFWPGYMKKLTELGASGFDWSYRSQHQEKRARFRKEWIFDAGGGMVRCRQTGRQSKSASLHFAEQQSRIIWVYENSSAIMDGSKYAVEFSLADN